MSVFSATLRDLTDGQLIARALDDGPETFEEIVRRYQRPIASYVYRMVGDYDLALDVTQDVFLKVHNSLDKYSAEYKFSTWIYRIAHNASIDHLRKNTISARSLSEHEDGESFELQVAASDRSPEQEREVAEWRQEIDEVVRMLPDSYRELIILRHARDLSYEEIALVTGLPLGTVKNRLFRARETMREIMLGRGRISFNR